MSVAGRQIAMVPVSIRSAHLEASLTELARRVLQDMLPSCGAEVVGDRMYDIADEWKNLSRSFVERATLYAVG